MNSNERKMFSILEKLKASGGAVGVKAEFEAEGTRTDELLRLLEISRKAGLKFGLKIGGCEAVRDLIEAKQFGVDYIIAPMVETPYALQKFIDAKNKVFDEDDRHDVEFLVNIETKSAYEHSLEMAQVGSAKDGIQGLVFGRVDFVGSCGMSRDSIDGDQVTDCCIKVASECKNHGLDLVVGGGVSINGIDALKKMRNVHLTRFETRKVIFQSGALSYPMIKECLLDAVHFELLWLINKRKYYEVITREDDKRIEMLESRWKLLNN